MTRILITALTGCILSGGLGFLLLPILRAMKAGQSIREIGPTWHNYKSGTPMMGGLMFIGAAVILMLSVARQMGKWLETETASAQELQAVEPLQKQPLPARKQQKRQALRQAQRQQQDCQQALQAES